MSSIHYKFKATLEYKTLTFDGLHISVDDLKKMICDKTESFDLLLTNTHTKRQYNSEELVPRNSSVIVQRIPRENAMKLPKVQDTSTSGIISRNVAEQSQDSAHISSEEFLKMTEEERLIHVKEQSTKKYQPSNFFKKTTGILTGPPPPTYICNRCSQPGHWFKACPLLNTKRTTGIPMEELMETTPDDPLAMLHPSGKYVVPIMHHNARQQKKQEQVGGGGTPKEADKTKETKEVPPELSCRLCKNLLREAMLAVCCGDSFCAECMQQKMLEDPFGVCPGETCYEQISTDALVPNKKIREAVHKFLNSNSMGGTKTAAVQQSTASAKPDTNPHSLLHKLLPDLAPPASSSPSTINSNLQMTSNVNTQRSSQRQPPMRVELQTSMPSRSFNSLPTNSIVGSAPVAAAKPQSQHSMANFQDGDAQVQTYLRQQQSNYSTKIELPFPPPNFVDFSVPPPIIPITPAVSASQIQSTGPSTPLTSGLPAKANNEFSTAWEKLLKGKEEAPQLTTTTLTAGAISLEKIQAASQNQHVTSTTVVITQPIVISAAANRQPPIPGSEVEEADSTFTSEPSKEINDAWESFLKRKDEEKKQRTPASNHSTDSSSSSSSSSSSRSSSSSSSASSGSHKRYRHSSRKRSSTDRHYSSCVRRRPMMPSYSGIRTQYPSTGQILYGNNYMATNVGAAGFGQPMVGYQGQQLYNPYGVMQQPMGHQQAFHYQTNCRRQGPSNRFDNKRDIFSYRGRPHISPERRRDSSDRKRDSPRNKSSEKSKRGRSKERDNSKSAYEISRRSRTEKDKESKDKSSESKSKRYSSREKVAKIINKRQDKTESEKVSTRGSSRNEEMQAKEDKGSNKSKSRNENKSEKKGAGAHKRKQEQKPEKNDKDVEQEDDEEEEDEIERIIQETKRIKQGVSSNLPADPSPHKPVNIFEKLALSSLPQASLTVNKVMDTLVIESSIDADMNNGLTTPIEQKSDNYMQKNTDESPTEQQHENDAKNEKEVEVVASVSQSSPIQQSFDKEEGQQHKKEEEEDKESRKKKEKKKHKHKHHHKQESKKKRKRYSPSRSSTSSHSKAKNVKSEAVVHNQLDGLSSAKSNTKHKPCKTVHKSKKEHDARKESKKVDHHRGKTFQKISNSNFHKSNHHEKSSSRKPEKKQPSSSTHSTSKRKSSNEEDRKLKRQKSYIEEKGKKRETEVKSMDKKEEMKEIQLFYD